MKGFIVWLALRSALFFGLAAFSLIEYREAGWLIFICSILDGEMVLRGYYDARDMRDRMRP